MDNISRDTALRDRAAAGVAGRPASPGRRSRRGRRAFSLVDIVNEKLETRNEKSEWSVHIDSLQTAVMFTLLNFTLIG